MANSGLIHKMEMASLATRTTVRAAERVLHAGLDPAGALCCWYVTGAGVHEVLTVFTGQPVPGPGWRYVSTAVAGPLVVHVFTREAGE